MGKRWQNERKKEYFYKKAKKEGYRSRAAFKLEQLDEKYDLIKEGDVILDMGAAPGGWLQVAREHVGESGFVLGVDLERIEGLDYENVVTIEGDITEEETVDRMRKIVPDSPDVVVSDASPDISGVWDIDHARSVELARATLEISRKVLKPGGNVLIKVFQGESFEDFLRDVKKEFEFAKSSKPKASRDESAEIYVIGKGFSPS